MNAHQRDLAKVKLNPKNKGKDSDIKSNSRNGILFCSLAAVEVRLLTYWQNKSSIIHKIVPSTIYLKFYFNVSALFL